MKEYPAILNLGLCVACKKPLPRGYKYVDCCDGYMCGCKGLPVEPWVCDNNVCGELAMNCNYSIGDYNFRHMWE